MAGLKYNFIYKLSIMDRFKKKKRKKEKINIMPIIYEKCEFCNGLKLCNLCLMSLDKTIDMYLSVDIETISIIDDNSPECICVLECRCLYEILKIKHIDNM